MKLNHRLTLLAVTLTCVFCTIASADYEELAIRRSTTKNGVKQLCYKPFLKPGPARCLALLPAPPIVLNSQEPDLRLTELALTELALPAVIASADVQFAAVIHWKGQGAGDLAISGPSGNLLAWGYVHRGRDNSEKRFQVFIDRFSDESLREQFDRGILFGENDAMKLHVRTEIWLEQMLIPALESYLEQAPVPRVEQKKP